jgi:hypothetical protein
MADRAKRITCTGYTALELEDERCRQRAHRRAAPVSATRARPFVRGLPFATATSASEPYTLRKYPLWMLPTKNSPFQGRLVVRSSQLYGSHP